MAGRRNLITHPRLSPGDNGARDHYLASLEGHLVGSARDRARVLDEIRSGLDEAAEGYRVRGLPTEAAAQAAVDDLGPAATVAASFAGELATRLARRILWVLLLTGPLVGIWWLLLLDPVPGIPQPGMLLATIPVLPLIVAAVATAIAVIATTGSLIRWLPEAAPKRALGAASAVAIVCVLGDLTMLSILGFRSATGSTDSLPLALVIAAIAASALRIVGAGWFARRCLRTRSALVAAA